MKTSEIIGLAHDYIEEHGWCQNSLQNKEGKVCLEGAVVKVIGGRITKDGLGFACKDMESHLRVNEAFDAVMEALGGEDLLSIPAYNDAETTTKQDVLTLLEKTQIQLEERDE